MLRPPSKFAAVVVVALVALALPSAAQTPIDPNLFMETIIDSLATTADAHSFLMKATTTDFERMINTRLAITKLNDAQASMAPFLKSDDAIASDVASTFSLVYMNLAELLGQSVTIVEKLVRLDAKVLDGAGGNYAQELAELSISTSKLGAEIDGAWKLVPQMAALSGHVLVDRSRSDASGKNPYLRITSKQRANLRARLERFFNKQLMQKTAAGQHAVQVAPALLWQFLGQSEWKPADTP